MEAAPLICRCSTTSFVFSHRRKATSSKSNIWAARPPRATREWLWLTDRSVTDLRLLHAHDDTPQVRNFREAQLQLESIGAQLAWPTAIATRWPARCRHCPPRNTSSSTTT